MKAFCPDKARQQSGALAAVNRASRKGKGAVKRNKDNHTHCNPYVQDVFKASEAREIAFEHRNFIIKKMSIEICRHFELHILMILPRFHNTVVISPKNIQAVNNFSFNPGWCWQSGKNNITGFHLTPVVESKLSFKKPQDSLFTLKLKKTIFNV